MPKFKIWPFLVAYMQVSLLIMESELTKLEIHSSDNSMAVAVAQLEKIKSQAQTMQYGECWTHALKFLQHGCRHLTDEVQRRISYSFTRCHFIAAGRELPFCDEEKPISECTNQNSMSEDVFTIYTQFFTHSQQICFHLQNQIWHEATEDTISRLADSSADVATQLEQSTGVAEAMMAKQNLSLKNQQILLQNEQQLIRSLNKSATDVRKSHAETKAIIDEQRALFLEVFNRVAVLQKTVLGEFSSIYTFGFYIGSTLLAFLLTSTTRTNSARIWLFAILIVNAIAEHMVAQYYVNSIDADTSFSTYGDYIPELIYEQTWLCRKIFCGISLFVLSICAWLHKDYIRINNALLNEIKKQNEEFQFYIRQNIQPKQLTSEDNEAWQNMPDGKKLLMEKYQSDVEHVTTIAHNVAASENDDTPHLYSVDQEDLSSIVSDCTFRESEILESDSEVSSVITCLTKSTNSEHRHSTPQEAAESSPNKIKQHPARRRSRKSEAMTLIHESNISVSEPAQGVIIGGYTLRKRSKVTSYNSSLLSSESVDQFESLVYNLAEQSASRRYEIYQRIKGQNFS